MKVSSPSYHSPQQDGDVKGRSPSLLSRLRLRPGWSRSPPAWRPKARWSQPGDSAPHWGSTPHLLDLGCGWSPGYRGSRTCGAGWRDTGQNECPPSALCRGCSRAGCPERCLMTHRRWGCCWAPPSLSPAPWMPGRLRWKDSGGTAAGGTPSWGGVGCGHAGAFSGHLTGAQAVCNSHEGWDGWGLAV